MIRRLRPVSNLVSGVAPVAFVLGLLWFAWSRYSPPPTRDVVSVEIGGFAFDMPQSWQAPIVPMVFGAPPISENIGQMRSIRIPSERIPDSWAHEVIIKRYLAAEKRPLHSIVYGEWANPSADGSVHKLIQEDAVGRRGWLLSQDPTNPEYDHAELASRHLHVYELRRDRRYVFHCWEDWEDFPRYAATRFMCLGRVPYQAFKGDKSLQIYLTGVRVNVVSEMFAVADFDRALLRSLEKPHN